MSEGSSSSGSIGPLRARTFRAAFASGGSEVLTRVVMIGVSIITARLLEPRQVGLLGLAVIVTGIVSMIGYYPEIAAISSNRGDDDNALAMAATSVRVVVVGAVLVIILGGYPMISKWVGGAPSGLKEFGSLLHILSITVLIEVAAGYPRVVLVRRMDLDFVALTQLAQVLVYAALAVLFLTRGGRTTALAAAQVAGSVVSAAILWMRLLHRRFEALRWPTPKIQRDTIVHFRRILIGLMPGFIAERVDNVLVASAIGPREMSFYSMAWNASHTPENILNRAISFVLVPVLGHIRDDPARVERATEDCLRYSFLMLAPMCALLASCAEPIVRIVLGPAWLPVVPCLQIMSVGVLTAPVRNVCAALLVARGRAQLTAISTGIHIAVLTVLIPTMATRWGIIGASYGELIAATILMVTVSMTARRATRMLGKRAALAPAVPVIAAVVSGFVAFFAVSLANSAIPQLIAGIAVIAVLYPLLVVLFGGRIHLVALLRLLRGLIPQSSPATQPGS